MPLRFSYRRHAKLGALVGCGSISSPFTRIVGNRKHQLACLGVGSYSYRPDFRLQRFGGQHPRLARLRAGSSGSRGHTESQSSLTHPCHPFEHWASACCVPPTMVQFAVTLSQIQFSSDSRCRSSCSLARTSINFALSNSFTDSQASTFRSRSWINSPTSRN